MISSHLFVWTLHQSHVLNHLFNTSDRNSFIPSSAWSSACFKLLTWMLPILWVYFNFRCGTKLYRTPHFNQYLHSSLSSTKSTYCNMMISLQGDQNPYLWIIHIYLSCRSQNRSVFQCAQHKETSHSGDWRHALEWASAHTRPHCKKCMHSIDQNSHAALML